MLNLTVVLSKAVLIFFALQQPSYSRILTAPSVFGLVVLIVEYNLDQ